MAAAHSQLRTKKLAKEREGTDKIILKCSTEGGHSVSVKQYLELLESSGIETNDKDTAKLDKLSNDDGLIERSEFLSYAKKSHVFKSLQEELEKQHYDKAELAFKAIDKDGSGYITVGELSKLGNMDQVKTEALMDKLDRDRDGKITLSEFRELFKSSHQLKHK